MNETIISLKDQWNRLKEEDPKIRSRGAAEKLDVSEAELLASTCDSEKVVRLDGPWKELIRRIEKLGYVMALTRNEAAVHEKKGVYQNFKFNGHVGLVLDKNIDLRIFLSRWEFGFAAAVENPRGILRSLQFFDQSGTAIHKVYLMNDEHLSDYQELVADFRHSDQEPIIEIKALPDEDPEFPDEELDVEGFLQEWAQLKDTHDFYPLLKDYKVKRPQALRLGSKEFTRQVSNSASRKMLRLAAGRDVPIMVFVRSRGVIQIHSGRVAKIKVADNWVNVLDKEFNLHLHEDLIDQSWIVQKPTEDGIVTSLELFDENDKQIITFFGARRPGNPELKAWRMITDDLT